MKLIIGGSFQGKLDFAVRTFGLKAEEITDGAVCSVSDAAHAKALYNLHLLTRRCLFEFEDAGLDALRSVLLSHDGPEIIISDEIGCGIVPLALEDRVWREQTGRLLSDLAGQAEHVSRIICGLEQRLK